MPGDVSVLLWLATPDCCIYGLFEIDCLMPWILYFLLLSSFPSTEASTFWHKQTIAHDGWRPDMTYMWSCCQGKSLWAWQKKSPKNPQGEHDSDWPRLIQTDPSSTLRQNEETSWTDRERQWSKMIGVCRCQLLKRSCCAMSLNEKPPHPPCCAKDDTPALAGDEQYKEWKDSLSVRTQVHERCAH